MPDTSYESPSQSRLTPAVQWLIAANVGVYFLQVTLLGPDNVFGALGLDPARFPGTWWTIATYMFVHGPLWHIAFNMLSLWMFGTQIERDWGTRRFLRYYFMCGLAAAACVLVANAIVGDWRTPTIGASGAIFGVLVAFGVLYPEQTILMNFLFPIKAKYLVMIYAAIQLVTTFGPNTGVSTIAHLGGMAFGYLYLKGRLPHFKKLPELGGIYRQWKMQRAKKKFQVYMRKHGNGPWVN